MTEKKQELLNKIRDVASDCIDENGKLDIRSLAKKMPVGTVFEDEERTDFNFLGKNYARMLASVETETVIVPDTEHNSKPENANSQNIYISGDNLDALKHLLKSYEGKIKCIYIDPPYNTGSDGFVYNDTFNYTSTELAEKLGVSEEKAKKILNMTTRGSSSDSAWLTFMLSRLLLAKDMLTEDGVIFISIDDNEQANLKLLCDDVFGSENFISLLTWEKKKKGSYLANDITNVKEYVLVYAKNKSLFTGLIGQVNKEEETYPCINASNGRDIRTIPAGIESKYREKNFTMKKGEIISDTTMTLVLYSDLIIENGILAKDLIIEGNWRYAQEAMTEYAYAKELYITRDLYIRRVVNEPRYKGLKDLLLRLGDSQESGYSYEFDLSNLQRNGWGSNEDADEEQRLLFGEQSLMSYPKPVLLIMKLLASLQEDKMVICDFFSGSATTAEAAMRLNTRGKQITFISVQLPENIDDKVVTAKGDDKKNAERLITFLDSCNRPHTIDFLGIERIERAAQKIRKEHPDTTADLGFKHFTLKAMPKDRLENLEKFAPDAVILNDNNLNTFGAETLLTTWMERDGYGLTSSAEQVDFDGYKGYRIGTHLYLLHSGLTNSAVKAIVEKYNSCPDFRKIQNIVLFEYGFSYVEVEALKQNLISVGSKLGITFNFEKHC